VYSPGSGPTVDPGKPAQANRLREIPVINVQIGPERLNASQKGIKETKIQVLPVTTLLRFNLQINGSRFAMATVKDDFDTRIRAVLAKHARLSVDAALPGADDDLYDAGMTSHATVNVMLALEGEFDVEFPDELLKRSVFTSISSINDALASIGAS
jgi:acyl carrier protein